jgi:hypothetical protein
MLPAQLKVQPVLELAQCGVGLAWDGHGRGLITGCMNPDLMLERVVVKIVCDGA